MKIPILRFLSEVAVIAVYAAMQVLTTYSVMHVLLAGRKSSSYVVDIACSCTVMPKNEYDVHKLSKVWH